MKLVAHARKSNSLLQMQVLSPNMEVEVKPVADNYTKNVLKDDLPPCPFPKSQEEKKKDKYCKNPFHTTFTLGNKIPINNPWLHSTEKLEKE